MEHADLENLFGDLLEVFRIQEYPCREFWGSVKKGQREYAKKKVSGSKSLRGTGETEPAPRRAKGQKAPGADGHPQIEEPEVELPWDL